ncbi:hypothetical protein, partial [Leisingera sp. JC1]|uniref:hypothetical protein n=1 Tax=Leisingera sp. JC1 TaxID=1855282 RepID=UPI001C2FA046
PPGTSRVVRPLARSLKASLIFLIGNLAIGSLPLSKERKATRHVIAQHPAKGLRDLVREPRNLVRAKSEWLSASDWNPCPRYPGARRQNQVWASIDFLGVKPEPKATRV